MANDTSLYRVMYLSKATRPMQQGELQDLLAGARLRNEARSISGMLLYDAFYRWARDATGEAHNWPSAKSGSRA